MQVSIREMKNHLSKYLRLVQTGEDVVITDRGRAVARLTFIEPSQKESETEIIARFRKLSWVRPGTGDKPKGSKRPIPWKPGQGTLSELVTEDRE